MDELLGILPCRVETTQVEVEQSEEENRREVIIPVFACFRVFGCSLLDRKRGIEEGPLPEMPLVGDLDFNHKPSVVGGFTEDVETSAVVFCGKSELFALPDVQVLDVEPEDGVEGADEEMFFSGILEDSLETIIDQGSMYLMLCFSFMMA